MKRAAVMACFAILAWAWVDRIVWGLMFEPHQEALRAAYGQVWLDTYHWGWADMLRGIIAVGVVALLPDLRAVLWFWLVTWFVANSGLEDALYYWLQAAPIPDRLGWLDGKYWAFAPVTPSVMAVSVAAHLIAALGSWWALSRIPKEIVEWPTKQLNRLLKNLTSRLLRERPLKSGSRRSWPRKPSAPIR